MDVAPTLLHIAGMPALTFWEIEDPSFDPGRIDAAPGDTARLLVVEAALAVAADWFLVPLRLPVATLSRLDRLTVTDTFGVTTEVRAADEVRPHPAWKLWRIGDLPYLLLPPPAAGNLISEPDEQVAIVRDENANLAWALQLVPAGGAGAARRCAETPVAADLTYVPITPVDADRAPLVLVETGGVRRLVRGTLAGARTEPTGTLVGASFELRDEELPDEGLVVEHRFELGRTPDGALHLWSSRAKRIGARAPPAVSSSTACGDARAARARSTTSAHGRAATTGTPTSAHSARKRSSSTRQVRIRSGSTSPSRPVRLAPICASSGSDTNRPRTRWSPIRATSSGVK